MPLIKSISGIRGTIGGKPGENLTPLDIVQFTAAYAQWLKNQNAVQVVVVGRDGRISGPHVLELVIQTLVSQSIDVVNLDLTTTPTVEMAVPYHRAGGGIIITASHNPEEWNALKLLNSKGEFISAEDGKQLITIANNLNVCFAEVRKFGKVINDESALGRHIDALVTHPLSNIAAIKKKNFKIVVDAINSSGAMAVPSLLAQCGVEQIIVQNADMHGKFNHNPEPLPENLVSLCEAVLAEKADLGIAVDPDVDRLCFVAEDGTLFGEEYTLVAIADYFLQNRKGNTVSNMSSTRALKDITEAHGACYFASAVGEVNVVKKMKEVNAIIGGEGNGGIIVPDLHYGRDALAGIVFFLTFLALQDEPVSAIRKRYPDYFMSKNKILLDPQMDVADIFQHIQLKYSHLPTNNTDGLKIDFENGWIHLRTSNTEPIIRIYTESNTPHSAKSMAEEVKKEIMMLTEKK
jgi:phosphomannomutase